MGEVINLSSYRKKKPRGEKRREASLNRLKFGLSKAEREQSAESRQNAERHLDNAKIESEGVDPTPAPRKG